MKQTKTRRVLLIVTLMMLVLTLGFGLLFMQREHASADESALELVPLADAELLATNTFKTHDQTSPGPGVFWDGNQSQMRLFFKVNGGSYDHGNTMASNIYSGCDKIFLTVNGEEKPMTQCGFGWVDSAEAGNGDGPPMYQIWLCKDKAFFDTVTEIKIASGFQYKKDAADTAGPATTRDYYLWKGTGDEGWQTRIESFTATYDGRLEQGGTLDPSKLNVTAQFKDGTSGTVAGSAIKVGELDTSDLGAKTVQLTYQDKTSELSVTVEEKRTLNDITLEGVDGITAERWTYPTFDSLVVKADFGGEEPTTLSKSEYTVTGYDTWAAGEKTTATVTYTYGETQKTKTFDITLTDNTATDKYFEILDDEGAARNVNSAFPGYYLYGLSFRVNFVGITDLKGLNLPTANYYFDKVKGIHLNDYIEFLYDGETKSATELFASGDMEHISFTDSGKLVLCFKDEATRSKVTQVTFKAGLQVASNQNAFDFNAPQSTLDSTAVFIENGVLKRDYVFSNGGAKGWSRVVDTLNVTVAGGEIPQNATEDEVKAKLTVKVKYKGETTETTLAAADYTVELTTSALGESVQGTVTYRGVEQEFTTKIVESKELDRIELSGTTEFTAKRFEAAPELTGFTVTVYYKGQDQGVELEKGFTVGTVDMWDTVGDHDIKVSYTEAGKTVEANLKLTIEAPDTTKGLEVLHDYTNAQYKTEWGGHAGQDSQLLLYFSIKGDLTAPTEPAANERFNDRGTHVGQYILINGEEYDTWFPKFKGEETNPGAYWFGSYAVTPFSGYNAYVFWFNPSSVNATWKNSVKTITIKAGFQWVDTAGDCAGLIVKEDITLYNAYDAGWQQKAESLKASVKEGADLTAGANIEDILDVKAVYGADNERAITGYTVEGYDKSKTVAQTVTVKYQDVQTTVEVTLKAPASVPEEITLDKNTLTVKQFELADFSTITATVKFTGDKADVTFALNALPAQASLSELDTWTKGEKKVTLTYSEGGKDITVEITVTVGDPDTTKGLTVVTVTQIPSQYANNHLALLFNFKGIDAPEKHNLWGFDRNTNNRIMAYIEITAGTETKTAAQWKQEGRIAWGGISEDASQSDYLMLFNAGEAGGKEWVASVTKVTLKAGLQWLDPGDLTIAAGAGWGDETMNSHFVNLDGAVLKEDVTIWRTSTWELYATDIEVAAKADAKFVKGTEDIKDLLDVKAVYSATEKVAITNFTIEGYEKDTLGEQTITVKYQDKEKTLKINVVEEQVTPPAPEKVTVTFDLNEGTGTAPAQTIDKGSKATKPADPTREGYTFDGWYTAKEGGEKFDFNSNVDADKTLFAHWTKNAEQPGGEDQPGGTTPGGEDQPGGGTTDPGTTPGGDTPGGNENPGTDPGTTDSEEDEGCGSVINGYGLYIALAALLGATLVVVFAVRKKRS